MENISISYPENGKNEKNSIVFDIKGDEDVGLNKSVINSLRRVLLSSIPSVGFRTEMKNTDIKIIKNTSPLHNEYILHRISMIPLYIDPEKYDRDLLFKLNAVVKPGEPVTKITSQDFKIYRLKEGFKNEDDEIDINKFSDKEIPEDEKMEIFRPFRGKYFCDITELKASNSDTYEELNLYGVPRVSYAYEDARWQAVSMATYSFKRDKDLINKVLNEKIRIEGIQGEDEKKKFGKSLLISESERYFHRDKSCEPYWYEFKIDSVHNSSSKELFIKANEIMIQSLELIKDDLKNISNKEESRISIEKIEENIYTLHIYGNDDTIGNVLQNEITRNIDDDSDIIVCGYKKIHPLENIIIFNISLKNDGKTNEQNVIKIIEVFTESANNLIDVYNKLVSEAKKNL
jgi:DNA-directed RNA polymerase subunit L